MNINRYIDPWLIRFPKINTSDESTPSQEHADKTPLLEQTSNPLPAGPSTSGKVYVKPHDLMNGSAGFRKFIDRIRRELLTIFVSELRHPPIEHFPSHQDLKMTFSKVLHAAGIFKKREIDDIIVSV